MLGLSTNSLAAGTPDRAAWDTYSVIITPQNNNAVAGGGVNDVVRVTVTDLTTGLPAVGFPLSFTISGTSVSSTPVTNASGYYDYGLASGTVGSADIIIMANGQTTTYTFTYIAGPPAVNPPAGSPNPSYFIVTQDNAAADGSAQDIVEVHLSNQYGVNEPAGTLVTLTVTTSTQVPTDALLNGTTTTTITVPLGANGIVDIPITDVTVGSVTLQATYPSDPTPIGGAGYTQTVHFVAGPPDPSKSYILVTQDPAVADGVSQDIVTAYLFDSKGRPVVDGTVVNFSIQSGTATIVNSASQAVTTGSVAAQYVSNVVGAVQVQGSYTYNGVTTILTDQSNPANNYATIHFTTGPPDPSKSYIVVTQDPAAADGASQDIVTAYLFDSQGRPTTGSVTFSIQSGTATLVNTVSVSNTVAAEYVSNTVGAVQVQAMLASGTYLNDQSNPANNYATIHFVVGPPDPSKSYIVVTQDNALADGVTQDIVTAYLFDAQGRAIKDGTNVTFSIQSGTATIVNAATQPVTTGSVSAQYVSTVVGAVQVQGSYTYNGVTTILTDQNNSANNYVTIHFVAGAPVPGDPGGGGTGGTNPGGGGTGGGNGSGSNLKYTVLFVRQDFQLADGTHQDSVIAYVTDANQHPLKNVSIQFFIQNTPASGTATASAQFVGNPTNVLTDDSGMARIAITSTMAGTVYVDAILVVDNVLIDGSYQVVTFVNAPDVTNPETKLFVVVYEALANGLGTTVVNAQVVDQNGTLLPGQDVTFTIDSGSATIITPQPVTTDINGVASIQITSKTPGFVLITATVGGKSITFGSPARVKFAAINIYVPPVFTPNGDGTNDVLKPILVGISQFHYFSVYNRWGNLIFQSEDASQGWDGRWKGVAQPVETYLWIAEGVDISGKTVVQRGMTSLVR